MIFRYATKIIKDPLLIFNYSKYIFKQSCRIIYYFFKDPKYAFYSLINLIKHPFIGGVSIGNHKSIFYNDIYKDFRKTRIDFLVSIFGKEWFNNKKIIEFGSGNGEISKYFFDIGSSVLCCEGRKELVRDIKERYQGFEVIKLNNDTQWDNLFEKKEFDLAIHWGLLYHLENWERDLVNVLRVAKIVCLESEVLSSNADDEFRRNEFGHDQGLSNIGTYVSSQKIEKIFNERNLKFKRYDSKELNTKEYKFDWTPSERKDIEYGKRRYWIIWT